MLEPGPLERSWRERLYRLIWGRWSDRVAAERIAIADAEANVTRELMGRAQETGDWEPVLARMRELRDAVAASSRRSSG